MVSLFKNALRDQFEASLSMLNECARKCPEAHWDGKIAKYTFWQVVYHTLCFVDLYLSPTEVAFKPRAIHPKGMDELNDEYPSRRFTKDELAGYASICHEKLLMELNAETPESLRGPSGHTRRDFSRAELYIYSLRHVQHHTGQLSAFLRRVNVDTGWVRAGWR